METKDAVYWLNNLIGSYGDYYDEALEMAIDALKRSEIIHCGECRFRELQGVYGLCEHITGEEIYVLKDEYYSWAERRTDGS